MFIICSEYQEFEKAVGFLERDTEIIQGMSTISSKLMGFISADVLLSYLILFGFFFSSTAFSLRNLSLPRHFYLGYGRKEYDPRVYESITDCANFVFLTGGVERG